MLQSVSEVLQALVLAERHSKVLASRRAADCPPAHREEPRAHRPPLCPGGHTADSEASGAHVDDLTVQIKAGKSEVTAALLPPSLSRSLSSLYFSPSRVLFFSLCLYLSLYSLSVRQMNNHK